ncbi:MAG: histidine--tRNA ligase [Pseudanabaenaceae cyanobacterium SKYGB_i_bin29]|nr:histidine--tRNA ligase [Pseudanabaenaceae cyanobacterium SKYG29]MDW8420271.1 histidine--tRNA ligase [Pseudanabaenaceae cyanobacterium SKYGB_i_bin29]
MIQTLRGTKDIYGAEIYYWQHLEQVAREILQRRSYVEIRTPILEVTELFARGIGETTDIVNKEMYTFLTKGEESVTLRPEGTAGVVRAYIQNKLHGGVQRLWYMGPMFRYERPQKGRQRQFHQLGVELLGSSDPRADAEVIALAYTILQTLGLKELVVSLNSVGDSTDRALYRQALVDYFNPYRADLDADSQQRLDRNPLRILDSKDPKTQAICQSAPSILDYLQGESRRRFERVQFLLTELGVEYTLDPRLVRGLDYYTHTAFEIQSQDLGAQSAVCGGGRYDRLVGELGGPETPAVGWAMGLERLILLLESRQTLTPPAPDFYIVSRGEKAEAYALVVWQKLCQAAVRVELDLTGAKFDKQLKRADQSGAKAAIILGDSEAENQTLQVKWLQDGRQEAMTIEALLNSCLTRG